MKIKYLVSVAFLTATVITCNESPTEITDQRAGVSDNEYIEALRSYPYTPDTTIVVDQEYLDNFLNCTTCIEPLPPPDDNAPSWTHSEYVERSHNTTLSYLPLHSKTVDAFVTMPFPYVAVGAGAASGRTKFAKTSLWGVSLNSQEQMLMNTLSQFNSKIADDEIAHVAPDSPDAYPNSNYALVGLSLRVSDGRVSKMWFYYAIYNNSTKEHLLEDPSTIKVVEVVSSETSHTSEVSFKIFDLPATYSFNAMKKSFIGGFGARTRSDNATKIGLLMVRY